MGNYKPGKGRSAKRAKKGLEAKVKAGVVPDQEAEFAKCPHTFVYSRTDAGRNVSRLVLDVRRVLEPFTASKLKVSRRNSLKDLLSVAGIFSVSHLLIFARRHASISLKITCVPRGPTFTFNVLKYSLVKDVASSSRKHRMQQRHFLHHPLLVMNNFKAAPHEPFLALVSTMFQNIFPSINVNKARLNDYKRCLVLDYNSESKCIEFRHYNIAVSPSGLSKPVKKVIKSKIPDLSKYKDIEEFVERGGNLSESEAEGPSVVLPQEVSGRGNILQGRSALRLTEIGPRLSLSLHSIQEGINSGSYLYGGGGGGGGGGKDDEEEVEEEEEDDDVEEMDVQDSDEE